MNEVAHNCHVDRIEPKMRHPEYATASARLFVEGMGCPRCAIRVQNALVCLDGVATAYVSLYPPHGTVRYDPQQVSVDDLLGAVSGAGRDTRHVYQAQVLK